MWVSRKNAAILWGDNLHSQSFEVRWSSHGYSWWKQSLQRSAVPWALHILLRHVRERSFGAWSRFARCSDHRQLSDCLLVPARQRLTNSQLVWRQERPLSVRVYPVLGTTQQGWRCKASLKATQLCVNGKWNQLGIRSLVDFKYVKKPSSL